MLEVVLLESGYRRVPVLHGVSLSVAEGAMVALFGPNGAGKSTLIKTIVRLLPIQGGSISFDGIDLRDVPTDHLTALGIAVVPQEANVFPGLTVEENLKVAASRKRPQASGEIAEIFKVFPALAERRRQRARTLSGGERQMLALAGAMISKPRLLLLDEPTSGLAPSVVVSLAEEIARLRESGVTILWVVGENALSVFEYVDRAYLLQGGVVTGEWTRDELLADTELHASLFGTGKNVEQERKEREP